MFTNYKCGWHSFLRWPILGVFPDEYDRFFPEKFDIKWGVAPARTYIPILMPLIEGGRLDPTPVITHRMSLDQVSKGYEIVDQKKEGAIKVVFSA